jgi:hypothetical protein
MDLRTKSDYFSTQHELAGLYNEEEKCLLRGKNLMFKYSTGYY